MGMKVRFYTNDWSKPDATLMGMVNSAGSVVDWKSPPSWLCSGTPVSDFRMGSHGKDELFSALQSENQALRWIIRLIGFALLWLAFSLMFGPLGVVADCIPCIGPFLGDSIETVTCCISCLPATACCSLVVGIVWTAMRPELGIPVQPTPAMQPVARQMQVQVPNGCGPGSAIQVTSPEGNLLNVTVPQACVPGSVFAVSY